MTHLLDVNVLIALVWPNHVHHRAARQWFFEFHEQGWATCPVTESGFIRVSSNQRVTPEARTPAEAAHLLELLCSRSGHTFLGDSVRFTKHLQTFEQISLTSAQVSDLHLIFLASGAGATFVTFDRGAASMAMILESPHLLLSL